jgi:NADP-dependent 3-hydroxy acid dehydrogenase YdfG|tara:strand:+ start:368 stop:1069 length:702 start_codon:yes stop_codon:yes gene_type:complete
VSEKICLITGVGPGTGASLAKRFTEGGYRVAMIARDRERLMSLEHQIDGAKGYVCDVSDEIASNETVNAIVREMGQPEIFIHNAVGAVFGNFMEIDPAQLNANFQTNVMGFCYLSRLLAPAMVAAGKGAIIASGNTSALRGKANFAGFAPTKAAQRIFAESMARELGPKGVHVAYVLIDAVIDLEWTREWLPDKPTDYFIQPDDIAETTYQIAHQPRSAWSFNVEMRPFGENW